MRFVRIVLLTLIWVSCKLVYGSNCPNPSLPSNASTADISQGTLYEYLKKQIGITCPSDATALTASNNIMQITLRKSLNDASGQTITVPFALGTSMSFSQISSDLDLAKDVRTKDIKIMTEDFDNMMCISMDSVYGKLGFVCQNKSASLSGATVAASCASYDMCFKAPSKSKLSFGFSGRAVECIGNALDNILFKDNFTCNSNMSSGSSTAMNLKNSLNSVSVFQQRMQQWVSAMLLLYVIIYGFKMALEPEQRNVQEIAMMIIKMIVVVYFATGFSSVGFINNTYTTTQKNGMQEHGLPLLKSAMSSFSKIVFNATSSGELCNFSKAKYDTGYEYYMLWDAIDCRLGKILFISPSSSHSFLGMGLLAPIMIFKFILSGQIVVAICVLIIVYVFLRMVLKFLSTAGSESRRWDRPWRRRRSFRP